VTRVGAEAVAGDPDRESAGYDACGLRASDEAGLSRLGEIRVPTLILVGDADIPDVHAHAGAIEAGIAGSKRVIISDAGHLMYLEKPEEFSRAAMLFIESNSD
jgi:3-oxoadipate enol-lactonase